MDPLFVSKFAFVIGLSAGRNPSTTELVRESVTELGGISDEGLVNRLSRLEGLTPDILQRATISSSYFGYDSSNGADALRVLEKSVHSLLRAKGVALDPAGDIPDEFRNFDPAKCECDTSLCEVLESLKKQEFTTLVLYGTEGTGKRSFAKWISQQLDRPLHVQDGTDLIGENEHGTARRVALALRYALQAGAVLFVDNAGELIASHCERDEADPNATLLAQLHSYSGILLLSVPYRSKHHVKPLLLSLGNPIKFRYLAYQKLREMFADYCSRLGLAIPSEEDLSELAEKDQVTPGAFFEAARAAWLTAVGQPRDFLYLIVSSNVYFDED